MPAPKHVEITDRDGHKWVISQTRTKPWAYCASLGGGIAAMFFSAHLYVRPNNLHFNDGVIELATGQAEKITAFLESCNE